MHYLFGLDHLEMLIGRSINNYSVHVAFLDRFEQMDMHRLRHIGWANKSAVNVTNERDKPEIAVYLEQFEKSVTYLLLAYLNISDLEARCSVSYLYLFYLKYDYHQQQCMFRY
jgi:hypothetical protein